MATLTKYKLEVSHIEWPASAVYYRTAESSEQAVLSWLTDHPTTQVDSVKEAVTIKEADTPSIQTKVRTADQTRAHHKARVTQMRNNATALMENENSILTPEERNQLAKASTILNRMLTLWPIRSAELKERS